MRITAVSARAAIMVITVGTRITHTKKDVHSMLTKINQVTLMDSDTLTLNVEVEGQIYFFELTTETGWYEYGYFLGRLGMMYVDAWGRPTTDRSVKASNEFAMGALDGTGDGPFPDAQTAMRYTNV
jgi:hypothetical protein